MPAEAHSRLFVSAPPGVAPRLCSEVSALGATRARVLGAGVQCRATLDAAYRICLWSRFASHVLLQLETFTVKDEDALYRGARGVDWPAVFPLEATFAVRATLNNAPFAHSGFAAQRVKDAIADTFRAACGKRPSVDKARADIRLHLHVQRTRATLSLDLAGESLHRRGYRDPDAPAPLKENLAAAILDLAGWPSIAARGGALLDPMCGSGTLLLEGAMMAANLAPGLLRARFGFEAWHAHRAGVWQEQRDAARDASKALPPIVGCDIDSAALRCVRESAQRLGLEDAVEVQKRAIDDHPDPRALQPGLLLTNPPYGVRMGDETRLPALYAQLGRLLRCYPGWRAALFTGNPDLVHRLRVPSVARHKLYNGAIACTLFDFGELAGDARAPAPAADSGAGQAFANRLRKNLKHLRRWTRREHIECYRVYDADIPEYAFAIDVYRAASPHAVVQEYAPPESVPAAQAAARRDSVLAVTAELLALPDAGLHYKSRRRQRGNTQYSRQASHGSLEAVSEDGLQYYVNFEDYLDTGLFLHHRLTRRHIRECATGRSFLNLFAYTGTASVSAAAGGATDTLSVDLSHAYLRWAGENLALNGLRDTRHALQHADCIAWMADAALAPRRWDCIFLDPPSFSNSKAMRTTLDVQRDHPALIESASRLLAPGGVLWFATNKRRFKLDTGVRDRFAVRDLSARTTPPDFVRRPAHQCWEIRPRRGLSPSRGK